MKNIQYYRPEWTCGRYNAEHHAAIFYNLIEGMSYYFEDASADIVGAIFATSRNCLVDIVAIASITNTELDRLIEFCDRLISCGLLTSSVPTKDFIKGYRKAIKEQKVLYAREEQSKFKEQTILGNEMDAEREYMERTGEITNVMFEMTYRCSEKCIHCYNPGATRNEEEKNERGSRNEIGLDDYKRIIDELYAKGLVKVCLSGGDPFSKDIVWDLIDYLYRKGIAIDIFTNGLRVYDMVERLANYYPRLIGVSLYSGIKSDHEAVTRVPGSFPKTMAFLEKCSKYGMSLNIKCCIMKSNIKSYYTVKEIAAKLGAIPQFDINITDSMDGDVCASQKLRLSEEMMEIVMRDADLPYYISDKGVIPDIPKDKTTNGKMCNAGYSSLCITPEGNVQPCCAFPMYLGNVKESTISDILESNNSKWWKTKTIQDCVDCHKHPYCIYCQMCPGNNYISNGNPLIASHNNCDIAIMRYNLSKKMHESGYDPLNGESIEAKLAELKVVIPKLVRQKTKSYRTSKRINEVS